MIPGRYSNCLHRYVESNRKSCLVNCRHQDQGRGVLFVIGNWVYYCEKRWSLVLHDSTIVNIPDRKLKFRYWWASSSTPTWISISFGFGKQAAGPSNLHYVAQETIAGFFLGLFYNVPILEHCKEHYNIRGQRQQLVLAVLRGHIIIYLSWMFRLGCDCI